MFPLAMSTAQRLGTSYYPFIIAVMMAASAGFATPIGYQTNLMVYGPGGYRFSDYLKIGVPLDILVGIVTVLLAPLFFPFQRLFYWRLLAVFPGSHRSEIRFLPARRSGSQFLARCPCLTRADSRSGSFALRVR